MQSSEWCSFLVRQELLLRSTGSTGSWSSSSLLPHCWVNVACVRRQRRICSVLMRWHSGWDQLTSPPRTPPDRTVSPPLPPSLWPRVDSPLGLSRLHRREVSNAPSELPSRRFRSKLLQASVSSLLLPVRHRSGRINMRIVEAETPGTPLNAFRRTRASTGRWPDSAESLSKCCFIRFSIYLVNMCGLRSPLASWLAS